MINVVLIKFGSGKLIKDPKHRVKGFTLIELVIAIGLLVTLSVVLLNIVANILRATSKIQAFIDLEQTSDFLLLRLRDDISSAYDVNINYSSSSSIFIKRKDSLEVFYTVEDCNTRVSPYVKCVKRNGVSLFDASVVGVRQKDNKPYFSAIINSNDSEILGLDVNFEIFRFDGKNPLNTVAASNIDTVIAVPND